MAETNDWRDAANQVDIIETVKQTKSTVSSRGQQLPVVPPADDGVGKLTSSSSQDSDESECWDDAPQDDDETRPLTITSDHANGINKSAIGAASTTLPNVAASFQPSSSSAYSSIQSTYANSLSGPATSRVSTEGILNGDDVDDEMNDDLIIHKAVFENDADKIFRILSDVELLKRKNLVNKRDKHGNTALHLACMLGRSKEVVGAFLQGSAKWSIDAKNLNRWTPFHEACSYGNRDIVILMARQLKDDVEDAINDSKLSDFLERTKNFRLVLKWEFQSWVPFIARVLPSDVCVINKQGKFIRIDTRLLDFEGLFRKRGDSCLIYSNKKWIIMNNKTKKYEYFKTKHMYKDMDDRINEFMSSDIMDLELKSSEMQLTRSTSGWIWKADKVGKVGRYNAALYDFTNVFLVTRKRREHLTEDDLKRNKTAYKSAVHMFKFGEKPAQRELAETPVNHEEGESVVCANSGGNMETEEDSAEQNLVENFESDGGGAGVGHRESLPPPPPTKVTWKEYLQAEPGNHGNLGREQKCKVVKTSVKASVAMSEEFPITKKEFLDLISIVPLKLFEKLKEFVEMKLPDGFPVRLDIPIFSFLTARITFEDFTFVEGPVDESLFSIPPDYEMGKNLLSGRFQAQSDESD